MGECTRLPVVIAEGTTGKRFAQTTRFGNLNP